MKTPRPPTEAPARACARCPAFTLLEIVGVLAIISILATAMIPAMMKQMDQAALSKEMSDMASIAAALQSHVLNSKSIPNYNNWVATLSLDAAMPADTLTNTVRGLPRAFLIDTNGWLGTTNLPFTQSTNGLPVCPTNARVMIVSTLGKALPVSSGKPATASFNDIWNTPTGSTPSTWTTWGGNPQDLVVQRINLTPLFHRLILVNGSVGGTGYFSIDGSVPMDMPTNALGWSRYFLDGTIIGLHDTNGTLVAGEVLKSDLSRVFDNGIWRDGTQVGLRTNAPGSDWVSLATQFIANGTSASLQFKGTTRAMASLITSYMYAYSAWVSENPCFSTNTYGAIGKCPEYMLITNALNSLSQNGYLVP